MSSESRRTSRLGRGLDALFGGVPQGGGSPSEGQLMVGIEELHPNPHQPRSRTREVGIDELADSIREHGVLVPILVRKRAQGGFEIVAGERRWLAAQRAGLREVPVVVRELSTQAAFEAALVENLQREDLNPIETALAFQRLIEEHRLQLEEVAKRVGKDRSTVANALRLLKLPEFVLAAIESGDLSEGHGRAILMAPGPEAQESLAKEAIAHGWSVRETERRARLWGKPKPEAEEKAGSVRDLEERLSRRLGARVTIEVKKRGGGSIRIAYSTMEELSAILARIGEEGALSQN
ncbi:MAG: ParB/RepB/Spo0J family partition protein [Sandaracinaceae bacterium]|nr:ParB/RepB/Spo0J family partition protein [Sandaracinaceae bacterium]